ncbi:receptor-like cytosolic serine/threonine-protein kinase RBK2 isoform X1 [Actinidia eriantha]|uniref:receptor-like cytosolic serine/threonine-protein kinase RBK2 isoform X1 n=1 Tax=Actinidia eriantha TaxID=165200 RepID=UPI00258304CF|nr:receptor-like cytosolic serine/threonine-protein kinase RBK2 isoform X1 [Actinidia eriantha]XP_057485749.1 receptor-like cytosolic serine/threonine-protein kinase RBK2 isoform X1 [Actinidia eriantha]
MENVPEPSTSPCNNAHQNVAENPEGEFFTIGHRRLFSAPSFSLSAEDLSSLGIEDEKIDESSVRQGVFEDDPESESASSKASTSDSEAHANQKSGPQWRGFFRKLKKGPTMGLHTFHPSIPSIKMLSRKKSRNARQSLPVVLDDPTLDGELYCFKSSWTNFSLDDLETATSNFSHENLIGEGGYSEVYKGHLHDGHLVAIKRLTRGTPEEMTADFLSELGILVHVNHPNIANVIGYGVEGGMHLVLHLSPHGSLASLLTGAKEKLEWDIRYKIALGTAEGLAYLHEGCQRRIIHRDIKAANILLREDFEPQVSDFGLAKWLPEKWTHLTVSQFEGTFGYLPPEFFMHGIVDEKTDVYAYGVLLLELITGRLALDKSQKSLVMWAKPLLAKNNASELVDPSLADTYHSEQLNRMVLTSSLCLHESSSERPQMSKVVRMLKGEDIGSSERARKFTRRPPVLKRTFSVGITDAEEYNSSKYLNDNQSMQIALEL